MASLNRVMIIGNLTRDPDLRYTSNGTAVASFGMAINRKFKQGDEWKEDVCYVDVTAWDKLAENVTEHLNKGSLALIEGRLDLQQWETDGQKRSKLQIVAQNVQFLDGKKVESEVPF